MEEGTSETLALKKVLLESDIHKAKSRMIMMLYLGFLGIILIMGGIYNILLYVFGTTSNGLLIVFICLVIIGSLPVIAFFYYRNKVIIFKKQL